MNEITANLLYLRLSVEIWLIALAVYSLRTLFRGNRLFGHGLLFTMCALFVATAVNYYLPEPLGHFIVGVSFTPALVVFGIMWVVALVRHNDSQEETK